jgi:hypothetical protein
MAATILEVKLMLSVEPGEKTFVVGHVSLCLFRQRSIAEKQELRWRD